MLLPQAEASRAGAWTASLTLPPQPACEAPAHETPACETLWSPGVRTSPAFQRYLLLFYDLKLTRESDSFKISPAQQQSGHPNPAQFPLTVSHTSSLEDHLNNFCVRYLEYHLCLLTRVQLLSEYSSLQ